MHLCSSRRNTITRVIPCAALAGFVSACGGSHQTLAPAPTTMPISQTAANASSLFNVVIQTTAVTGPSFCIWTPPVGATFNGDYGVSWGGSVVAFSPPDPIDWDGFTGTLDGLRFTAMNPPESSGAGMCAHYQQTSTLSGTFSPDYSSFTATETLSLTPDSGEARVVTFSWSGTRR